MHFTTNHLDSMPREWLFFFFEKLKFPFDGFLRKISNIKRYFDMYNFFFIYVCNLSKKDLSVKDFFYFWQKRFLLFIINYYKC